MSKNHSEEYGREVMQKKLLSRLVPGDIVKGSVIETEAGGVLVDIGRTVPALLSEERIALVPCRGKARRFNAGQELFAAVLDIDREKRVFLLTHYELLGTFRQNAAGLERGGKVDGIWRGNGIVEITPNLWGIAGQGEGAPPPGSVAAAEILDIDCARAALSLKITGFASESAAERGFRYFISEGRVIKWEYAERLLPPAGRESVFFVKSCAEA